MNKGVKGLIEVLIAAAVFLFFSYLIQLNINFFQGLITNSFIGMLVYILLEIVSIVIAPVTTLPLVVVASKLWGWVIAGILNVAGWFVGSLIAFVIARKYGIEIVKKFIPVKKIYEIEKKIPKENLFWSVVLLRIIIPVDVLSYALGIFSKMNMKDYLLSTAIGIIPFAFLLTYLGGIDIKYQILLFLFGGILILIGWITKLTCKKCVDFVKNKRRN